MILLSRRLPLRDPQAGVAFRSHLHDVNRS
jgi:hypothetical protein